MSLRKEKGCDDEKNQDCCVVFCVVVWFYESGICAAASQSYRIGRAVGSDGFTG